METNFAYDLADTARLLRRAFDQRMREIGVTSAQARLLLSLGKFPGRNQTFYADNLEVEPITLCRMVDRMEENAMIERRPDPGDRRARLLFLTEQAESEMERIRSALTVLIDQMHKGLSAAQRQSMSEMLATIRKNLVGSSEIPRSEEPVPSDP